jgi:hypothetical protein
MPRGQAPGSIRARWKKGKKPGPGRPKGMPNKVTKASRDLVVLAASGEKGDEGVLEYLTNLKKKKPAIFGAMFARTIDTKVKVDANLSKEVVRIVNLTGLDLSDPKVRKRLGPSILGELPEGVGE